MTKPAGTFTYGFDGDRRMNSLTYPRSETSQWRCLDTGWLVPEELGDGAIPYNPGDGHGFLVRLRHETSASATPAGYGEVGEIQYDSVRNVASMPVSILGSTAIAGTSGFNYNLQDKLTHESSSWNWSYSYSFE